MSRAELTYREVELQWNNDVLSRDTLPNGERLWYNEAVGAIKFISPVFHSDSTKFKLRERNLGMLNPNFKGMVVATEIKTGHQIAMFGTEDIRRCGFTPSEVTRVIQGKSKHHKGYTFERKDNDEQTNSNEERQA